jgi:NADP-dependent 3-hydroxy acid dehydrogenase YdfG
VSNTVLITGSSSGIGKATAKQFQQKGWNVAATMRTPEKETELNQLDNVLVTRLDVQDATSIASAVEETIDRFGGIDALVNNAGFGTYGPLEAIPMENVRRQFDVNVLGLIETMKAVLPHFRERKNGVIVNISSLGGKTTFPLGALYHGTKFAVEGISESLSYELALIGVRMKIVEPGAIKTEFVGRSFDFNNDESLEEYQGLVQALTGAMIPMIENGMDAARCAEVIYTAATDDSDQLRYLAGPDAEQMVANREKHGDQKSVNWVKRMFGL